MRAGAPERTTGRSTSCGSTSRGRFHPRSSGRARRWSRWRAACSRASSSTTARQLLEDFWNAEEHIRGGADRAWEACMTFNGSWGYFPTAPDSDWHSSRAVIGMLQKRGRRRRQPAAEHRPRQADGSGASAGIRSPPAGAGRWLARAWRSGLRKGRQDLTGSSRALAESRHVDVEGDYRVLLDGPVRWDPQRFGGIKTKVKRITILRPGDGGGLLRAGRQPPSPAAGLPAACPDDIAGLRGAEDGVREEAAPGPGHRGAWRSGGER